MAELEDTHKCSRGKGGRGGGGENRRKREEGEDVARQQWRKTVQKSLFRWSLLGRDVSWPRFRAHKSRRDFNLGGKHPDLV